MYVPLKWYLCWLSNVTLSLLWYFMHMFLHLHAAVSTTDVYSRILPCHQLNTIGHPSFQESMVDYRGSLGTKGMEGIDSITSSSFLHFFLILSPITRGCDSRSDQSLTSDLLQLFYYFETQCSVALTHLIDQITCITCHFSTNNC